MALMTIGYCLNCKWRSSPAPLAATVANAPCPTCKAGILALHYDPTDTAPHLPVVGIYAALTAAQLILAQAGVPTADPEVAVPLPLVPGSAVPISTP